MSTSATAEERAALKIRPQEFQLICSMIYDNFGIDLNGKEVLVAARLGKQMRSLALDSIEEYCAFVQRDSSGEALSAMVDALTTNHTSFYREPQHFDFLRKVILPELNSAPEIRIWSSACSSGEEPYTIAFTAVDELGDRAFSRISILATDISTQVLQAAQRGVYPACRFEQMPVERLRCYLLKGSGESQGQFLVKKQIRSLITFQRLNLMEDFSRVGRFSVIFCRNVMIYFDRPTQQNLVNKLAHQLEPGGYLLIGHAESLNGIDHPLTYLHPAIYRKQEIAPRVPARRSTR